VLVAHQVNTQAVDIVLAAGFEAIEAESAEEAILILERRFDIAVCSLI
jgi:hypothetical protein